jgi:hypothetical protein
MPHLMPLQSEQRAGTAIAEPQSCKNWSSGHQDFDAGISGGSKLGGAIQSIGTLFPRFLFQQNIIPQYVIT